MNPRANRSVLGLLLAATLLMAPTACSRGDTRTRSAPPTATATTARSAAPEAAAPSADPTAGSAALAEAARTAGTPVQSGSVTLEAASAASLPVVTGQDDGSVLLTIAVTAQLQPDPAAGSSRVAAVLAATSGLRFEVRADRSIALLGSAGEVVGALPRVVAVDDAGGRLEASLVVREPDDTLLELRVAAGAAGVSTVTFGATPLVRATWGEREGGRSLAVVPAAWVRTGSLAAQDSLWSALVAAVPEADSPSMHDQLSCHALGAADKDSWNLEPWRPEVGSFALLAASCNP